jgi:hypothetical protein
MVTANPQYKPVLAAAAVAPVATEAAPSATGTNGGGQRKASNSGQPATVGPASISSGQQAHTATVAGSQAVVARERTQTSLSNLLHLL